MSYYEYEYDTAPRGLYRSRDGILCGVCAGIAEFFDVSVFWTRAAVVGCFLITGFWPTVVLYGIAALVMKKDPYTRW